jgi:DNA-directed RNA polymerase subunit RPC12/RpoP
MSEMNWITAKFDSECAACTRNIDAGERILFDFEDREARCSKCGERIKPDPKKEKGFQ